ncbi:hypothetical protein MMC13_004541 [Lambiella insularis]|nr:hypothetical protein [Lambiella insularis]
MITEIEVKLSSRRAVNATARDFHGFTKEMSFARLVLSTSSVEEMPRFSGNALPSRETGRDLVQQCLKEWFTLYPILSDTAIFGSLEAVYQQRGYLATSLHRWNLRLAFAIALMSRSRIRGDSAYRDAVRHASSALENVEAVIQPGSIAGLQAILLLVLYAMLDPSHFNGWYLIGVASRVTADLGLHQEPAEELRVKEPYLMLRRRIFYCVYNLDRAISLAHVRAFSFSDASVNVTLPDKAMSSSSAALDFRAPMYVTKGSDDPASQLLNLRQIESEWYQSLFQSSHEVIMDPWQNRSTALVAMHSWAEALPNSTPNALKSSFLSEMFFSSILLLSPRGRPNLLCLYGQALIFDNAVRYSEVTLRMCDSSHNYNYCTNYDTLRALLVGHALLGILEESPTAIYNVLKPTLPRLLAGSAVPPAPRRRTFVEILDDAICSITRMNQILDALGRRFGSNAACDSFNTNSTATLQRLYAKRQDQYKPTISKPSDFNTMDSQIGQGVLMSSASWDLYGAAHGFQPL